MTKATMFEAKTNLSELVKKAQAGETVIITSGKARTPVATLQRIEAVTPKRMGVCYNPKFVLPEDYFDPPTEAELNEWES